MRQLPAPIRSVGVPATLSPSRLGSGQRCRLRMLSRDGDSSLAASPEASLGTVLHGLLEDASRGWLDVQDRSRRELALVLDGAIRAWQSKHEGDPAVERFHDLRSAFTRREFEDRTAPSLRALRAIAAATPYRGPKPPTLSRKDATDTRELRFEELGPEGSWPEVRIESLALRISGKADLVEKMAEDVVVITDYKSGKTHDQDGLLESIALQLNAYGLAARDLTPGIDVRLKVHRDREYDVRFEPDRFATELRALTAGLGSGGTIASSELLGEVGPRTCRGCPIRHRCEAYLHAASGLWQGADDYPMPVDVWGELVSEVRRDGESDVRLRDSLGQDRLVKRVSHARHGVEGPLAAGQEILFFGLRARATRRRDGTWLAPTVFHDLAEQGRGHKPAWAPISFTRV